MPVQPHVPASSAVAQMDRALDLGGDIARVLRLSTARARTIGGRVLLLQERLQQHVQRPLEDLRGVPARDDVAQQVLRELQLLVGRRAGGEGHTIPAGRERVHDRERHVRLRESLGQELLKLTLALAAGGDQQLLMVAGRQMRGHQPHGGQVDLAGGQEREHGGIPPYELRRLHPVVGFALGQAHHIDAIRVQGREASLLMEPPRVQLGQVRDQRYGGVTFAGGQPRHGRQEISIGEMRQGLGAHALASCDGQSQDPASPLLRSLLRNRARRPPHFRIRPGPAGSRTPSIRQAEPEREQRVVVRVARR